MWQRGEVRREKLAVEEPSSSVPLEMWPGCKEVVCRVSLPCLSRLGTRPNAIHSIALVHYWAMGVKGAPGGSDAPSRQTGGSLQCRPHSTWHPLMLHWNFLLHRPPLSLPLLRGSSSPLPAGCSQSENRGSPQPRLPSRPLAPPISWAI